MKQDLRRVVCWNCQKTFQVDVSGISDEEVVVYRGRKRVENQTPPKKLVVKCPYCEKENEVRV